MIKVRVLFLPLRAHPGQLRGSPERGDSGQRGIFFFSLRVGGKFRGIFPLAISEPTALFLFIVGGPFNDPAVRHTPSALGPSGNGDNPE